MYINFQESDPSLESQWRSIILFGKNSATYKFAFAKALLGVANKSNTVVSLSDLAPIFVDSIIEHLKENDRQGNSNSSTFLQACREFNAGKIDYDQLISTTIKYGFVNVVDAFQNVNGEVIQKKFYEKVYNSVSKKLVITDSLLKLKESIQFDNFNDEIEARWNLVETAWNLQINPNLLEVKIDEDMKVLYLESSIMRRKNVSSSRASLNGYQKGKCFYSFQDISITSNDENLCAVDHFFPHVHKIKINDAGANVNGIWNLVLADRFVNIEKNVKIPELRYLERLYKRNEFYIASKHPLGETIINQTGKTSLERRKFLQKQYDLAVNLSLQKWKPLVELEPLF